MKKHSFGKGLNTVYDIIEFSKLLDGLDTKKVDLLKRVPVSDIIPNKHKTRNIFDQESLKHLADSIIQKGIIQPLMVRDLKTHYELIAGERRWLAAQIAGLLEVPVVICDIDDNLSLIYSLVENLQREDLNLIDKANAFWRMQQEFHLTHEQIAKQVSYTRTAVTNILRLLSLPESVKDLLQNNKLDLGHARALVGLSYKQQEAIAKKIVARNMTVREVELLVKKLKNTDIQSSDLPQSFLNNDYRYEQQLSEKLLSKVIIKLNSKGIGKIIINVESTEYLDWLIDHLNIKN